MQPNGATVYRESFLEGFTPEPILTVSEWSDRYRMLSQKASAEPGRWRTSRTPYLREIMDCLSSTSAVEEVVFIKGAQVGGPLALDTPIPTPTGWTTMGAIQPGDRVFDENGKPCRVVGVSPVFHGRRCLKVTFSDGSTVICDNAHLWTVDDEKKYEYQKKRTIRAGEIERTYKVGTRNRYAIPVTKPLDMPEKRLPIHPYALGVWLGDGSSSGNQVTQSEVDAEEMGQYIRECGYSVVVRKPEWCKGRTMNLVIDPKEAWVRCKRGHDTTLPGAVTKYGRCRKCVSQVSNHYQRGTPVDPVVNPGKVTFGAYLRRLKLIGNKRIPRRYLRASVHQRLELLQGLMDTDGHITKKGRLELTTSDAILCADIVELLHSLGLKPVVSTRHDTRRESGKFRWALFGVYYRIGFMAYAETPVFKLKRKLGQMVPRAKGRASETERRRIVNVTEVPSVPVRCIEVDSGSHLYLCGRAMIPTHNTECGNNWLGYIIDHAPGPIMAVQPTVDLAKRNSKQRIAPLIEESPRLRGKVSEAKSRDSSNTILEKDFQGGRLVMTGANSAAGLRSMPARYLFLDEVDAYPGDVDGEGDPVSLAKARTRTFARRKVLCVSTPTISGRSRIEALWELSDQRRYYLPCPYCDGFQHLEWSQLKWPPGEPHKVVYMCIHCEGGIEEYHKTKMLERGEWRAENPGARGGKTAGFHLNSLYSPLGWFGWRDAVEQFQEAKDKPELLRGFVNTVLGETWKEKGDAPEWQRLYERREPYAINTIPPEVVFLTAGVDVQKDRLEVEIVGWGRDKQTWSIDYRVLHGDTAIESTWSQLDAILGEQWEAQSGVQMGIRMLAVDSGFNTQHVYNWARKHPFNRVMAIKGVDTATVMLGNPSPVDVHSSGKRIRRGFKVWPLGVSLIKSELYAWLKLDKPIDGGTYPPGYCHFPEYGDEYFKQLTAEQLVVRTVRGYRRYEWQKTRDRNEALDARGYARAAAAAVGIDRMTNAQWDALMREVGASAPARPQPKAEPQMQPEAPTPAPRPRAPAPPIQRKKSSFW